VWNISHNKRINYDDECKWGNSSFAFAILWRKINEKLQKMWKTPKKSGAEKLCGFCEEYECLYTIVKIC